MITTATLKRLIRTHRNSGNAATVLSAVVDKPVGYGRIKKSGDSVSIIEEKDAARVEKKICEVNSGIYCFYADELFPALKKVRPNNKKHEYYLTDAVGIMSRSGKKTGVVRVKDSFEVTGINDRTELARVTKIANGRNLQLCETL
jgi:bifunctional N-acetylglucosamine-1-phosphate-uridyltransferase/glucosamine-1-phosphate-acetyltransferase GlmU-like protein